MLEKLKKLIIKLRFLSKPVQHARYLGVNIGKNCRFSSLPDFGSEPWLTTIGDDCIIASNVSFIPHDGSVNLLRKLDPKYANVIKFGKIVVGNNCFIGKDSTIMPNVRIGDNCIVGACSLVTKDVPDGMVVAGVPAKVICTTESLAEKLYESTPEYKSDVTDKKKYSTEVAEHYWKMKNKQ